MDAMTNQFILPQSAGHSEENLGHDPRRRPAPRLVHFPCFKKPVPAETKPVVLPYALAESSLYMDAFLQAARDAGMEYPPPVCSEAVRPFEALRAIVDGLHFLFNPADRRRYYIASFAGIDNETVDSVIAGLLDPSVIPRSRSGVSLATVERIRERIEHPRNSVPSSSKSTSTPAPEVAFNHVATATQRSPL